MKHVAHSDARTALAIVLSWVALAGCHARNEDGVQLAVDHADAAPSVSPPPTAGAGAPDPSDAPPAPQLDASLPATASFSIRIDGDFVYVDVRAGREPMSQLTCSGFDPILQKPVGDTWEPLQDDRPPVYDNPGYYLDGQYVPPGGNLGCDFVTCDPVESTLSWAQALEFVKTDTMSPPSDVHPGPGAPPVVADPADVLETRRVHGPLRARFLYSSDASCRAKPVEVVLPFELPDEGAP